MSNKDFKITIEQLDNELLEKELLKLYETNPEEASKQFRIEMARKIMKENKTLFERLSKL